MSHHLDVESELKALISKTPTTNPLLTPPPINRYCKVAIKTPETYPRTTPEISTPTKRTLPSQPNKATDGGSSNRKNRNMSILESILRQQDENGTGMSQAATTDIAILLWMMMDVGNAWTAMALTLISRDEEACELVQDEIDYLVSHFGPDAFVSKEALGAMTYLDALLYEAIRQVHGG